MSELNWVLNRMKAMSVSEILWRLQQKALCKFEQYAIGQKTLLIRGAAEKKERIRSLGLLDLSEVPQWHACEGIEKSWPLVRSNRLRYKQNDAYGDARISWEINRLHRIPRLLWQYKKDYREVDLYQAAYLFYDWIEANPFLMGISWTSLMEFAIRGFQFLLSVEMLSRLDKSDPNSELIHTLIVDFKQASLTVMQYVKKHYSRHSSANNHLLVEMTLLGYAGNLLGQPKWTELAISTLKNEFIRQNHTDGVNKEQSLHYHLFVMEALALHCYMFYKNDLPIPKDYISLMKIMSEYVADLGDRNGNLPHLGDDDAGAILSISGKKSDYHQYVLQFTSVLTGIKYTDLSTPHENLNYLFDQEVLEKPRPRYRRSASKCYREGGHTILKHKNEDSERILTLDHGELGFGSIAAHGHADALSITLSVDGEAIIVDPGTYIYHAQLEWRDYFRKTLHHNTIEINGRDQSEMLGAFLWGKRANCKLEYFKSTDSLDRVKAWHDGYQPICHERQILYCKPDIFKISDRMQSEAPFSYVQTFTLDSKLSVERIDASHLRIKAEKNTISIASSESLTIEECWISKEYGFKEKSLAIKASGEAEGTKKIETFILINMPLDDTRKFMMD